MQDNQECNKDFRKALYRQHGVKTETKSVYFHKYFDKTFDDGETRQHVIFEMLNGEVLSDSISDCSFRFCSNDQFIENLNPFEVEILIKRVNDDQNSAEKKAILIKKILDYTPGQKEIVSYQEKGFGHWNEGIVSGWKWSISDLLKKDISILNNLLTNLGVEFLNN